MTNAPRHAQRFSSPANQPASGCVMKPLTVVIAQSDPKSAEALAASLHNYFKAIHVARTFEEVCASVPKHRADLLVIDLELASLPQVEQLRRELPATAVVCTHRLADEDMWAHALAAGALDCCHSSDIRGIVLAADRDHVMARSTAA
jgi:DNA-binding NarL/FixJ family response regulator